MYIPTFQSGRIEHPRDLEVWSPPIHHLSLNKDGMSNPQSLWIQVAARNALRVQLGGKVSS